jgi:hypothetical protein
MRLCKDCKYCINPTFFNNMLYHRCKHPLMTKTCPVTGKPKYSFADLERIETPTNPCGENGRLWEPKNA